MNNPTREAAEALTALGAVTDIQARVSDSILAVLPAIDELARAGDQIEILREQLARRQEVTH